MANTKDVLTRIKVLDELFKRPNYYTMNMLIETVNEKLADLGFNGVERRTIEKDIQYLKGAPFYAPIVSSRVVEESPTTMRNVSVKRYYYEDRGYSVFKEMLSAEERNILSESLSLIGRFEGLPNCERLNNMNREMSGKEESASIVSLTKTQTEYNPIFAELFRMISDRQVVKLFYHTFNNLKGQRSVVLHPYQLREYNRRWSLVAGAEYDKDGNPTSDTKPILIFPLDRIDRMEGMPDVRYVGYKGNLDKYFQDVIGLTVYEGKPEQVRFWVSDNSKDYVRTKKIHSTQKRLFIEEDVLHKKYPTLQGGAFYEIRVKSNYELIRELSSFGPDLVVLSPGKTKDAVVEKCEEMIKRYKSIAE